LAGAGHDMGTAAAGRAVPASLVSGWDDACLDQTLEQYRQLRASGGEARLVVGPWNHTSVLDKGWPTVFPDTLQWLRARLSGEPAGQPDQPVRVHVGGCNEWRDLPGWPPPQSPVSVQLQVRASSPPLRCVRAAVRRGPQGTLAKRLRRPAPATACPDSGTAAADGLVSHDGSTITVAMSATAYRFGAGHRLRLQISGGATLVSPAIPEPASRRRPPRDWSPPTSRCSTTPGHPARSC
jgi:predicted acyl esterase